MSSESPGAAPSRIAAAQRRARTAKIGMVVSCLTMFGVGIALVKANVAGHSQRPLRPLEAPARFQAIVRGNALAGGLLAPAQAPPSAATSQS